MQYIISIESERYESFHLVLFSSVCEGLKERVEQYFIGCKKMVTLKDEVISFMEKFPECRNNDGVLFQKWLFERGIEIVIKKTDEDLNLPKTLNQLNTVSRWRRKIQQKNSKHYRKDLEADEKIQKRREDLEEKMRKDSDNMPIDPTQIKNEDEEIEEALDEADRISAFSFEDNSREEKREKRDIEWFLNQTKTVKK